MAAPKSIARATKSEREGTEVEKRNLDLPPNRPLKVYAFDPTRGHSLGNLMTLNVKYEELRPGPVGKYLEVVDYDGSNGCYYQPVNLDDPAVLLRGGLNPSESDPQFHQQMVYAVSSQTIRRFEFALGREIKWSFSRRVQKGNHKRERLRIFPHAMQEANAFYDPKMGALLFGYFPASDTSPGVNLPGQTVFTCLSHDIIVHETTHALVDSQREFFTEPTSVDTPAFHEAFADIVALFQHFGNKDALLDTIQRTGGRIHQLTVAPDSKPGENGPLIQAELTASNPMVELAKQFGEAMGMRKALRSALGTPPNSDAINKLIEPHTRGSLLVAAVFDAFFTIYIERTRDLMRIARAGGLQLTSDDLHPDLANRLAKEAAKIADHFANICIRALDYCPPVDILFGDFLRALITADYELVPDDDLGYRTAIIEAFRSRGIRPEGVVSYSEESLRWCPPEVLSDQPLPACEGLDFNTFRRPSREQMESNAKALHAFAEQNRELLKLTPGLPVQVYKFHPVHRVGPSGQIVVEMTAELMQQREVPFDKGDQSPGAAKFKFRGGVTLILDINGNVRYYITKSLGEDDDNNARLRRQREYQSLRESQFGMAALTDERMTNKHPMNFNMIHRGY